ncbi:MAG: alkaline phosphatase family protein [Planctomycetota bacterium]
MRLRLPSDRRVLVVLVVGLRPVDLADMPALAALVGAGRHGPLRTVVPAVTSTVQASLLTGLMPRDHGVVANGWYFRDLAQVWFWRQSRHLIQGPAVYDLAKAARPGHRTAQLFWWFNMYTGCALSVTPRPQYHADGYKTFALYSEPPELERELERARGAFPFHAFWGPLAGLPSSRWIAGAAADVLERHAPDLALVYLPHLDYDHQRFGPGDPRSRRAARDLDGVLADLCARARERGYELLLCSEYGIEDVERPVFPNRALRAAGLLRVQDTAHGELLDAGASRAFAVVDHQCAHVYVRDEADLARTRAVLAGMEGVARVLDREGQCALGLDHERAGELFVLAERGTWLAYNYWLEEDRRPDFAPTVDIHRKPGYDPAELFVDPRLRLPRLRVARRLLQKQLGFRYLMDVVPTDPSPVRGSHGLEPAVAERGPMWVATEALGAAMRLEGEVPATRLLVEG